MKLEAGEWRVDTLHVCRHASLSPLSIDCRRTSQVPCAVRELRMGPRAVCCYVPSASTHGDSKVRAPIDSPQPQRLHGCGCGVGRRRGGRRILCEGGGLWACRDPNPVCRFGSYVRGEDWGRAAVSRLLPPPGRPIENSILRPPCTPHLPGLTHNTSHTSSSR